MLLELKVSNFAIIHKLEVEFSSGLNILSGETGAGKSVLLKSLALLMGEKAFSDTVRTGAEQALVEGLFDLESRTDILSELKALDIETPDNTLAVRRLITAQGKSRVYLNGHLSALNILKDIVAPLITVTGHSAPLIELTGQHENKNLQSKAYHLEILDHYTGSTEKRLHVEELFRTLNRDQAELAELESARRDRDQKLDFLRYQRDEIKGLNLKPNEDAEIEARVARLRHSARLAEFAFSAQSILQSDEDSVLVKIHHCLQRAADLKSFDEDLPKKLEGVIQAKALVEDAVYELREYARGLTADPEELAFLEERLSAIRKVQKKFGGGVEDILERLRALEDEIAGLESAEDTLSELAQRIERGREELRQICEDLHNRRRNGATLLIRGVNEELEDLNMKGVKFGIHIDLLKEPTSGGITDVEFTISPSKKDDAKPLAKVASGGELSRILLAIKRIVGQSDLPRTYLFDEVDTGVSGPTAEKVGRKLKSIARGQQVICVTHLPQVAAFADSHYVIDKSAGRSGVEMAIRKLNKTDRVREIARLVSGEKITQTSLDHARQLLTEVQ